MEAAPVPDREMFLRLARPGRLVPVYLEFAFDIDTAVTAYAKLRRGPFGFLLESVEGGERWARYSFLGSEPREAWRLEGSRISRWRPETGWSSGEETADPFAEFESWIGRYEPAEVPGLPRFWGGAVGYFGYDTVRWLERLPPGPEADLLVPDACFLATDRVLVLDNLLSRALAVRAVPIPDREGPAGGAPAAAGEAPAAAGTPPPEGEDPRLIALYEEAVASLRSWIERLVSPHHLAPLPLVTGSEVPAESNRTREDFEAAVERVRDYIRAGDAYQVVVSQRLRAELLSDPLDTYRALRILNPSPYLFFLEMDGTRLIGSSPESLVRVEEGSVTVRPIAGTRPRGRDGDEDEALARELMEDEKERAEHLMLVDLGRNDVGRVARPGTVRVPEFMKVERYSHVMHLVSEVTGRLEPDRGAMDALRACFPAGTLTGAPKVRAMEIIDELEPTRRGPYGGAAGYVAYGGRTLDMAIVIRTILAVEGRAYAQAGAGVVHDSLPSREWEETGHKARVLLRALAMSEGGGR